MTEIKILTPVGMLGYGFPEADYKKGLAQNPDAVILDSGSTDPGPYMLGTGATMVKPMAYERDLRVILSGIGEKKNPLIIGSAGGDGTNDHVEYIANVITDILYEITFDIMFSDRETYDRVKNSGVLCEKTICDLYHVQPSDIIAMLFFEPALAFKFTLKRPGQALQGSVGDSDTFGTQQHAPLLDLIIP